MSWGSWNIALPSGRCLGYVWLRNWLSVQWTSMLWLEMIETIFVLIFTGHYWGWRGWSENCFLLGLPLGSGCWCRSHQPISSQPFLKQKVGAFNCEMSCPSKKAFKMRLCCLSQYSKVAKSCRELPNCFSNWFYWWTFVSIYSVYFPF